MKNSVWLNLPVKDLSRAKAFYTAIGARVHPGPGNSPQSASLLMGSQNIVLMLFAEKVFEGFTRSAVADTTKGVEILISLEAISKAEVDEMVQLVEQAGGTIFGQPQEVQGWMYGMGFSDPDGHRWNMLYLDSGQQPQK